MGSHSVGVFVRGQERGQNQPKCPWEDEHQEEGPRGWSGTGGPTVVVAARGAAGVAPGGGGRGGTLDMTEDIGDDEYARTS